MDNDYSPDAALGVVAALTRAEVAALHGRDYLTAHAIGQDIEFYVSHCPLRGSAEYPRFPRCPECGEVERFGGEAAQSCQRCGWTGR